jgi:hypothetical protein
MHNKPSICGGRIMSTMLIVSVLCLLLSPLSKKVEDIWEPNDSSTCECHQNINKPSHEHHHTPKGGIKDIHFPSSKPPSEHSFYHPQSLKSYQAKRDPKQSLLSSVYKDIFRLLDKFYISYLVHFLMNHFSYSGEQPKSSKRKRFVKKNNATLAFLLQNSVHAQELKLLLRNSS